MHPENSFVTLTYDDQHLKSSKLIYEDFQKFIRKLRDQNPHKTISYLVTGEYGEKNNRPHWHAIIFNYRPTDLVRKYSNEQGNQIYSSKELSLLWPHGTSDLGNVTYQSAGYVARYALKKLKTQNPEEFFPISKKSSKHAIGKTWLEKYWPDVFNYGYIILPDGNKSSIPRYYEKWLQKYQLAAWQLYRQKTKFNITAKIVAIEEERLRIEREENLKRAAVCKPPLISKNEVTRIILRKKIEQLTTKL
jgi:hypothetical protein